MIQLYGLSCKNCCTLDRDTYKCGLATDHLRTIKKVVTRTILHVEADTLSLLDVSNAWCLFWPDVVAYLYIPPPKKTTSYLNKTFPPGQRKFEGNYKSISWSTLVILSLFESKMNRWVNAAFWRLKQLCDIVYVFSYM